MRRPAVLSHLTGGAARTVLGLGVSAIFGFLFLRDTDFGAVSDAFTSADVGLILIAMAVFFGGVGFRALRWHILLRPLVDASPRQLYPIMAVGYAANNILPLRGGEIVRAHTLYRQFGVGHTAGLANVFLERVLDGVMLTLFLVLGVAASLVGMAGMEYAGDVLLATMAFLVFGVSISVGALYAIARHPARAESIIVRRLRRVPVLRRHDARWVSGLIAGVRPAGDRALLTAAFFASAAAWGLEALMYFLVGEAFGLDLPLPVYLLVVAAANVIISAPSTSGGVGPFEWAAKEVVLIYLVGAHAQESAIAYAASLHGLVLVPITLLGLAFLWYYHVPVRRLLRGGATPEEEEDAGAGDSRR